ncbi:MAG: low affinity iron permease family protein [Gaiellales bacterium]
MGDLFHRFAERAARAVGSPWAFASAVTFIAVWAVTGPTLGFSTTWQLLVNTTTTIITFLIVFLIQNTQNREAQTIQLKLDELLLRALPEARNKLLAVEDLSDEDLSAMVDEYRSRGRTSTAG